MIIGTAFGGMRAFVCFRIPLAPNHTRLRLSFGITAAGTLAYVIIMTVEDAWTTLALCAITGEFAHLTFAIFCIWWRWHLPTFVQSPDVIEDLPEVPLVPDPVGADAGDAKSDSASEQSDESVAPPDDQDQSGMALGNLPRAVAIEFPHSMVST
jgi:hypothetical protein